ncbi:MAG TPA: phosphate ABC transporter permease subunit PstC [Bacteroidales bacterium]|nr:phosphate ABC transporter permease subunit PstC [Bacteroidales bacterium]HPS15737.1 phosphate ABC transporter permease subunit PstC [Bacteroidales bacterium]
MRNRKKYNLILDSVAGKTMLLLSLSLILLLFLIIIGLSIKSFPVLKNHSFFEMIFSSEWKPLKGKFGMLPFISGTAWVTMISVIIAVPACILTSIYFSEYAKKKLRNTINPVIDILAGIPSVVYGVWGIVFIVPLIKEYVAPIFGISSTGYTVFTGGLVLALMIVPVIIHVLNEVFNAVPHELREASLSLGATKWQTIKFVVVKKALPGIIAAIILGVSRAFGETMAVLMVVGNVIKIPHSIFDAGYPLPALIANNYGEMMSIPMYDSALMFSALILLVIVIIFNVFSRIAIMRVERIIGA